MIKLTVASLLLATLAVASALDDEFELYQKLYNKQYKHPLELKLRKEIFLKNKQFIDKFNVEQSEKLGFKLGLSHLTDLSKEELAIRRGAKLPENFKAATNGPIGDVEFLDNLLANATSAGMIPDELDWRKVKGRVSSVKDQGQCGSCWAFASTGALEGQMALMSKGKKLVSLSEQNLVDCSKRNSGCAGGLMSKAFKDIAREGGIDDEQSYPYKGVEEKCKFNKTGAVFDDKGYVILEMGNEVFLKKIVATYGPVSVLIDARNDKFHAYSEGVYNDDDCKNDVKSMDHAVLVVGYGRDKRGAGDYWLVKNSWSENWGEKGYIRMSRNKGNQCGIATAPIIPTF